MKRLVYLLFFIVGISAQSQLTIKGKVVDELKNPMPFVNVFIKGTSYGTTTDDKGRFSFTSKKRRGVLEISSVGFQTHTIKVNHKTKFLNIVLKEGNNVLEEVVVVSRPKKRLKKKENPAYRILKEIWKRKRKNGVKQVDYYQYKKHTTTEVGLNNLDTSFIKTIFKEQYKETMEEIKYDSDGINYYIPMHMKEQIATVYGNNKLNKVKTDVEAEKEEGLDAQGFVFSRIGNTFRNFDVFKNNITLLRKSFISPLSSNGFATYDYLLYDSIVKNNTKLYNIYFFPIRNGDLAFQGNIWVTDKNFSIKKLKMKVTKDANLNFVRGLTFEKEFSVKNDSIYIPTKNVYEGDFTFLDKNDSNKGLTIKKTVYLKNYIFGKAYPSSFYDIKKVKIKPDQYAKDETYWNTVENQENKSTYHLIKSVKGKRKIKQLTGLINTVASGYINLPGNIQYGPFWTTFGYNDIEGLRTRIGLRTFKTRDDRFRVSGHIAYATKNKRFNYGIEGKYLLSYEPRITIGLAYQDDIEQLGSVLLNTTQLLGNSFGNVALFSRGSNYFLSTVKKYATNFDYAVNPNLHFGFNFSRANITSAAPSDKFSINYTDEQGKIQNTVIDVASDVYISFTPGRNVYGLGVQQKFGKNVHPSIVLSYRHGYKGAFQGTHTYNKIQLRYNQPIMLGAIGLLDATIEGGKTFGTVPISLLNPIPANQSYSLVRNTFALMNYYDYVTDTYAATHLEHHFNGFIMNRIPLIKKLKLRSLITFRAAYGTISKENIQINHSNITYNTPNNKPYYEYGIGLENIGYGNLRILRLDAIWRSDYTPAPGSIATPTPTFAIRIAIKPNI